MAAPQDTSDTRPQAPPRAAGGTCDIAVVGASAGGIDALQRLAAALPADYPGSVCVVMHISPQARSELPRILARAGPMPAVHAADGMALTPGRIFVAPPDMHLLVQPGVLAVVHGPRENRHRPAVDPLFRSAAWSYGPRVVGVVLSGTLDDGTAGLWAVRSCGGTTVVQEPGDAQYPEMPEHALLHNRIDHRLPVEEIGALLHRLAQQPAPAAAAAARDRLLAEIATAQLQGGIGPTAQLGAPTPYTCPSCRGALWEIEEGGHLRYRCHTGHAFSQHTLLVEQDRAVEESLYVALRAVQEKSCALQRLAERMPTGNSVRSAYLRRSEELEQSASLLKALLGGGRLTPAGDPSFPP